LTIWDRGAGINDGGTISTGPNTSLRDYLVHPEKPLVITIDFIGFLQKQSIKKPPKCKGN